MKTRKRIISWFVTFSMLLTLTPSYAAAEGAEKPYRADDVTVMQGQEGFTRENLMDDIEYDSAKYKLALEDDGGFDIDTPGEYTLRYSLTPIAAQETPEVGIDIDTPGEGNQSDSVATGAAETLALSFEIDEPDAVSYILTGQELNGGEETPDQPVEETPDQPVEEIPDQPVEETPDQPAEDLNADDSIENGGNQPDSSENNAADEGDADDTPAQPEESIPQDVIYFSRMVYVLAKEEPVVFDAEEQVPVVYDAVNNASQYSVDLGNAVWKEGGQTVFTFPQATVTGTGTNKIYSVTIFAENGAASEDTSADIKIKAFGGEGWTFIYQNPKSPDEMKNIIRGMEFTPNVGQKMNVSIVISGNRTEGFDASKIRDFTYNPDSGVRQEVA